VQHRAKRSKSFLLLFFKKEVLSSFQCTPHLAEAMAIFCIRHTTTYTYRRPVALGVHRLQLRPRESRDIRIVEMDIAITPAGALTWANDVFGNAIASVRFAEPAARLVIESRVTLEHQAVAWPLFGLAPGAVSYPFTYSPDEISDLGALLIPQFLDPACVLPRWAQGFVGGWPTDTLALLKDINTAISAWIEYEAREDEGTQSPLATLERRKGSCRDIAVLMIEAVRWLGFGARIVSGYLINRDAGGAVGSSGAGSTHAWVEVFLPGAGWVTFDPTNRTVGDFSVIPIAVARDIKQAVPVSGSFAGEAGDFLGMEVEVSIS
jgi:transglutaminase-like putative cysteine protease